MAGEDNSSKVENIIHSWIVDYICFKGWREFKDLSKLNEDTVDLISGVINTKADGLREKCLFLFVLCRLNDAETVATMEDYGDDNEEGSTVSILEDMLEKFKELIQLQKTDIQREGAHVINVIKSEAVLVCCRRGDFVAALEVFNRLWSDIDKNDKMGLEMSETLRDLLVNGEENSDILKGFPYTKFIESILMYLAMIYQHFEDPILIKAAKDLVKANGVQEQMDNADGEVERRTHTNKRFKLDVIKKARTEEDQRNNNADNEQTPSKRKIRKLWNDNIQQMFGVPSPEQPSSSTDEFRKPATPSATPKKSMVSPCKSLSSDNSRDDNMSYRKNKGRPNRHDHGTALHSTKVRSRDRDIPDDISDAGSLNESIYSVSGGSRRKWTEDEMIEFYDAVKMIGVGKWAEIKTHLNSTRTGIMLKDKWRTMIKNGDAEKIGEKRKKHRSTAGKSD